MKQTDIDRALRSVKRSMDLQGLEINDELEQSGRDILNGDIRVEEAVQQIQNIAKRKTSIYITGDTHIPIDIRKLNMKRFPEQRQMTKDDFVIICGDFGGVWAAGNQSDKYWLDWLKNKSFTTLFLDGNHENFDLLDAMPVQEWCGGKVHFIRPSVIHLMRGQVYEIAGKRFFVMGGAHSYDKAYRKEGRSWWARELPCKEEYEEAIQNLERADNKVDYILTHTAPLDIVRQFYEPEEELELNRFLQRVADAIQYGHWYFGHVHEDRKIDGKHTAVYHNLIQLEN